uniref:Uncharacterized protein n=1 Tax=Arundo donax TaxID=35708 RepID=A0A0A8YN25_ARUDO
MCGPTTEARFSGARPLVLAIPPRKNVGGRSHTAA